MSRDTCLECERVARYMANDPEMYRDEPRLCASHAAIRELQAEVARLRQDAARLEAAVRNYRQACENKDPHSTETREERERRTYRAMVALLPLDAAMAAKERA